MITTLYKRARTGKVVALSLEIETNMYRSIDGEVGGKMTTSAWTIAERKNVGRANETSEIEQAQKEYQAKIDKKLKEGYSLDIDKVDESAKKINPMLAEKWKQFHKKVTFPVYTQPKLDGIRCIITKDGAFSREGNPFQSVPHIIVEAQRLLAGLPEGTKIDGELYNHSLHDNFNKIVDLVKNPKPTQAELVEAAQLVKYHIFDLDIPGMPQDQRFGQLYFLFNSLQFEHLVMLDTELVYDLKELDKWYQKFLVMGYEGQMIRSETALYENGRTKHLLKRKEFRDEEFTIVDILEGEGNRAGMAGKVRYGIDGVDYDPKDKTTWFGTGIKGGELFYRRLWVDKPSLIGQQATVRYQNLTPGGKPRFGVTISIRDYE